MSILQSHCRAKHWRGALAAEDFRDLPGEASVARQEDRYTRSRWLDILLASPASSNWGFIAVELVDCSLSGIGFVHREPMEIGEQFLVKLCIGGLALLRYRVRHCAAGPGRRYRIGAEFIAVAVAPEKCCPEGQAVLGALMDCNVPDESQSVQ